jgi:hypothetical protein
MGVALGLFLVAAGAILTWAVNATVSGLDINAVGVILMLLGIALVALDIFWWQSWQAGPSRRTTYVEPTVPLARPTPPDRVVVEEEVVSSVPAPPPGGPPPPP